MTYPERAQDTLGRKLAALRATVTPWLGQIAAMPHLRRMTSQTQAVTSLLNALVARIEKDLGQAGDPRPVENRILAAWQFWNSYRVKFDQRGDAQMTKFLRAADELAWLCYKPARDAARAKYDPACKEPPLVYCSAEASPFIDPRAARFQPDGVPERLIQAYGWPRAATMLPFPIIGVPLFQPSVLPGGLAIVHETGHAVEGDFGLESRLRELIQEAPGVHEPNRAHWLRWSGEMFADVWGCLGAGASFVSALSDQLLPSYAASPDDGLTTEYPPPPLRIWWNLQVLRCLQCPGGEAVWTDWKGQPAIAEHFPEDAAAIATQWLEATFPGLGGRRLRDVLYFSAAQFGEAEELAKKAAADRAISHKDVRVLWAAMHGAFTTAATGKVLEAILKACDDNPRGPAAEAAPDRRLAFIASGADKLFDL